MTLRPERLGWGPVGGSFQIALEGLATNEAINTNEFAGLADADSLELGREGGYKVVIVTCPPNLSNLFDQVIIEVSLFRDDLGAAQFFERARDAINGLDWSSVHKDWSTCRPVALGRMRAR